MKEARGRKGAEGNDGWVMGVGEGGEMSLQKRRWKEGEESGRGEKKGRLRQE